MNKELENMRKEMAVACFRYHSSIWGGGTEEAHKHLSISGVGPAFEPGTPEPKFEALLLRASTRLYAP